MINPKRFGLLLFVAVGLTLTTSIAAFRYSKYQDPKNVRQILDKSLWPVTDYTVPSETNPEKAAKRRAKGKKFNKSDFRVHPDDLSENTTIVDAVDRSLPVFPIKQSAVVLTGTIVTSQAFVSEDRTGVYSEFTVKVDEVLKSGSPQIMAGDSAEVERAGGRVKFPSGRVHWYSVDKENMPGPGRRYVFFLKMDDSDDGLQIITAYELRDGKVFPLDDLRQFLVYEGKDEADFMIALRTAVQDPQGQ
jgi:hypothetical protein